MGIDEDRLRQIYENWETEDLIMAVTIDKAKYEPFGIDLINREGSHENANKHHRETKPNKHCVFGNYGSLFLLFGVLVWLYTWNPF